LGRLGACVVLAAAAGLPAPTARSAPPPPSKPASAGAQAAPARYDVLLRGGRIVDGTGSPWFEADLAIRGDRIAAIGPLKDATARTSSARRRCGWRPSRATTARRPPASWRR